MLTDPPSPALDLLVIGGLTVDRFADGSSAAGGSVLHIARATNRRGIRLGVVTVAGREPAAATGLDELRRLAQQVDASAAETTATFRHQESAGERRLWLEERGGTVASRSALDRQLTAKAVLYAPIGDEVGADAIQIRDDSPPRAAILQGWLRETADAGEVTQLPLDSLDQQRREALAALDLVVASRDDLAAEATAPSDQLDAMRRGLGRRPALVVTDATGGLWLDVPGGPDGIGIREHLPVPVTVEDVPTIGAGDILAAFLTMHAKHPPDGWRRHAAAAMQVVAEELEARRGR